MDNNEMRNRVLDFGVPPIKDLEQRNLVLLFDDDNIKASTEKNYHCNVNDVKFCVFDIDNAKPIFSMDFFACNPNSYLPAKEHHLKMELLYVHDSSLRNKGIASYYVKKLQQYALENNFKYIKVHPNPNAKNFVGNKGLSKKELIKFYNGLSTNEMPIIIV